MINDGEVMKKSLFVIVACCVLVGVVIISVRAEGGGAEQFSLQVQRSFNFFQEILLSDNFIIIEESNAEAVLRRIHFEKVFTVDAFGDTAWYQHDN